MKILFVYRKISPFIQTDIDILKSKHDVKTLEVRYNGVNLLKTIQNSIQGVLWSDLVFSWFGGHHTLIPFALANIINHPCIIVASGFDVANVPKIDYGHMRPGYRRRIGIAVFNLADRILAVSEFTAKELKKIIPEYKDKLETVYHGFNDTDVSNNEEKQNTVITIGGISQNNLKRKGIETFVKAATYLPDTPFIIIGGWDEEAKIHLDTFSPHNVEFKGYLKNAWNSKILKSAKVYVQSSYYESFGCSVAEAMLHKCIPVVTKNGALPEVVGDAGIYVPYGKPELLARGIQNAQSYGPELGERARQRILDHFPLDKRRERLLEIIDEVSTPKRDKSL